MSENIAVVAPMPSASESTATAAKQELRRRRGGRSGRRRLTHRTGEADGVAVSFVLDGGLPRSMRLAVASSSERPWRIKSSDSVEGRTKTLLRRRCGCVARWSARACELRRGGSICRPPSCENAGDDSGHVGPFGGLGLELARTGQR